MNFVCKSQHWRTELVNSGPAGMISITKIRGIGTKAIPCHTETGTHVSNNKGLMLKESK